MIKPRDHLPVRAGRFLVEGSNLSVTRDVPLPTKYQVRFRQESERCMVVAAPDIYCVLEQGVLKSESSRVTSS